MSAINVTKGDVVKKDMTRSVIQLLKFSRLLATLLLTFLGLPNRHKSMFMY